MSKTKRAELLFVAVVMMLHPAATANASAHAAIPVPRKFCKSAEIGKNAMTVNYNKLVYKLDGSMTRWPIVNAEVASPIPSATPSPSFSVSLISLGVPLADAWL